MSSYYLICVFLMALFTYLPRMLPLTLYRKKINSPFVQSALYYLPYAVLGALTFPGIIESTASFICSIIGGVVAVFFSYKEKGLVFVAIAAILASYIASFIF